MEERLGHNFADVRVHTDDRAAAAASLLGAEAYAHGSDLVFNAGAYNPEAGDGEALLAHELTHVVQQRSGETAGLSRGSVAPDGLLEREAEWAAEEASAPGDVAAHDDPQHECPACKARRLGLASDEGEASCGCHHDAGDADTDAAAPASLQVAAPAGGAAAVAAPVVQRSPWDLKERIGAWFAPDEPTAPMPGHTPGSDYSGPFGEITKPRSDEAGLPEDKRTNVGAVGGAVSYGCYCGPGGDPATGSRCGPGAAAVDAIDEQCRQHDLNYGARKVDSGSRPGTVNMWSPEGLMASADADQQLHDSVESTIDADPSAFSSSARLYGQGIKGIFGARSRLAGTAGWGMERGDQALEGIGGAYGDAANYLDETLGGASDLLGQGTSAATDFASERAGSALGGVTNFLDSASQWDDAGDAAWGLLGGAGDAAGFGMDTLLGGAGLAGEGALDAASFYGDRWLTGMSGAGETAVDALSFAGGTGWEALQGAAQTQADITEWTAETGQAITDVGLDLAGDAASWAGEQVPDLDPRHLLDLF